MTVVAILVPEYYQRACFSHYKGRNRLFGGTLVVVLWQFATDKAPPIKAVLLNLQK